MTGRMKAPDNHDFPEKCPKKSLNCARIAENTYRTDQRKSVLISADQSTVRATIKDVHEEHYEKIFGTQIEFKMASGNFDGKIKMYGVS